MSYNRQLILFYTCHHSNHTNLPSAAVSVAFTTTSFVINCTLTPEGPLTLSKLVTYKYDHIMYNYIKLVI